MAHYAFLDENDKVVNVIAGVNEDELIEGMVPEAWYTQFTGQKCLRTSYNTYGNQHKDGGAPFRKNYAAKGFTYDETWDAFIPPKPFPSWNLDIDTFLWEAPVSRPQETEAYTWKWFEPNQEWIQMDYPTA